MTDNEFLLQTLLGDVLKVAKVNLVTGEYVFIKKPGDETEQLCCEQPTIKEYIKAAVDADVIYPQDIPDFMHFISIDHLKEQIDQGKKHFAHSYRRHLNGTYAWITFVLSVPETYSEENPWVVFRWELTDDDHHLLEDSLRILSTIFHKILKINITEDSYVIVKGYKSEFNKKQGFDEKISEWMRQFALSGNVHEDDKHDYLHFTDLDYLRDHFKHSKEYLRCRYRRRTGGTFRWVAMELVPSIEYTDDNQVLMLYIKDIQDEYVSELHYQKELELYCNTDVMTGLWNRFYYTKYIQHLAGRTVSSIGMIFADLNGLKQVNDQKGHAEGDKFIRSFAILLAREFGKEFCCRISGDEFLVLLEDLDKSDFEDKVEKFRKDLRKKGKPIASVGSAWSECVLEAEELVKQAELAMYEEKQKYYDEFPEDRR